MDIAQEFDDFDIPLRPFYTEEYLIYLCNPLTVAIREQSIEIIYDLIFNNKIKLYGWHIEEIVNSSIDIVEMLFKNGFNIFNIDVDGFYDCPLISCRKLDIIKVLLKYGADINYNNCINVCTPLLYINDVNIAKILIENGANVNSCDINGNTPLICSCKNGIFNLAKMLIENGADINVCNNEGLTPLIIACKNKNLEIVEFLIKNGANVNVKDKIGRTPFNLAKKYDFPKYITNSLKI